MTIQKAWPFQVAIYQAIATALPDVDGFAFQPDNAPDRYWRIDGWTLSPEQAFKNKETAYHGVMVHVIDAPAGGTDDLQWVKETMATIHTAINGMRLDDNSRGLTAQTGDARLEPKEDKVNDAHAFMRYTAAIE